jgi:hypothetical protein
MVLESHRHVFIKPLKWFTEAIGITYLTNKYLFIGWIAGFATPTSLSATFNNYISPFTNCRKPFPRAGSRVKCAHFTEGGFVPPVYGG